MRTLLSFLLVAPLVAVTAVLAAEVKNAAAREDACDYSCTRAGFDRGDQRADRCECIVAIERATSVRPAANESLLSEVR